MNSVVKKFLLSICLLICFSIPSLAFAATDNVKPIISGANNKTIYIGASFNPLSGVTAKDNVDGNITKKIKVSGKVNTKKAGTYKLTYSVTDKAKNKTTVARKITVKKDTTKPKISGASNKTIYIGTSFNPLSGVAAKDNADGNITKKIKVSGKVNTKKAGTYKLTYSVSDKAKNKTTVTRKITVKKDTVKPKISGVSNKTIYTGASFNPLSGVTAKDNVDGTITKKIKVSGKVNTQKAGTYKLTYSVSDKAKNKTTVTRTITVKEKASSKYISIEANGKIQPGIYKLTNTKLEPIVKGNVYKWKYIDGVGTKGTKVSFKNSSGFSRWEYLTEEYAYPVEIGNTVYFAKFEKMKEYGAGGSENLYKLYKYSNGKVTKVNDDYISDGQGTPLFTYNGNLYYFQGQGLESNYNVIKLMNNKKSTLLKNVEDFWIAGSKAYYLNDGKIYHYNWSTKKSTAIETKYYFHGLYAYDDANYIKASNGIIYDLYSDYYYYYDYSTRKTTKIATDGPLPIDILPNKNIMLTREWADWGGCTYYLYDPKGKRLKTLNIPKKAQVIDISLAKREVIYLSDTTIKILKF